MGPTLPLGLYTFYDTEVVREFLLAAKLLCFGVSFLSVGFWGYDLGVLQDLAAVLFPSQNQGPLPCGILHRELHVSPQQSSLRGALSPGWLGLPKTEEVLSSCLLEKAGLGDVSVPKPNPSRCLLSLPSHSSPGETGWKGSR